MKFTRPLTARPLPSKLRDDIVHWNVDNAGDAPCSTKISTFKYEEWSSLPRSSADLAHVTCARCRELAPKPLAPKPLEMTPGSSRVGLVHIHLGGGQHAPCGAKIGTSDHHERIESSSDDLTKVTCVGCRVITANFVKRYNRAKRQKLIDWDGLAKTLRDRFKT